MFALSIPQEIVLSFVIELTRTVQFTGGYVWQYWLSTGGPRWVMKIISDRQKVKISRCHRIILIFDMRKSALSFDLQWQVGQQLREEMSVIIAGDSKIKRHFVS